jgi:hypothetical protein
VTSVLRIVDASFVQEGRPLVAPFSLTLGASESAALVQPGEESARIAARIAAAIVKPTQGRVFVGDFDARLQPAQAKRLVGFVPSDGFCASPKAFEREVGFRADVWDADRAEMQRNADAIYAALQDSVPQSWARAVALARAPGVCTIVLENVSAEWTARVAELRPDIALLTTGTA